MKLAQLFSLFSQLKWGQKPETEVKKLSQDSRDVDAFTVFFAIRGSQMDGHQFLPHVCSQNVAAVVVEEDKNIPQDYNGAVVVVEDTRKAMSQLASRFYGNPTAHLFCVGVTGTNGKTSLTYLVEKILTDFGWKTGVLGTIDHHLGERKWQSHLTTPGALDLQKRLAEFKALGAQAVVFEVSSHAIAQKRANHIDFDTVVFTNLTHDHLDYHMGFTDYFQAKEKLFSEIILQSSKNRKTAIINKDDEYGQKIFVASGVQHWTYGRNKSESTIEFEILKMNFSGTDYKVKTPRGEKKSFFKIPGAFYMYNVMAAIGVGLSAGVSLEQCCDSLESFQGVPGRLERVKNSVEANAFVDYAHTPDALRSVLKTLNDIRGDMINKPKILTVFGCGGDRDKGKRPLMRKVAEEYSDLLFVTSDNPRTEDPQKIIEEILEGNKMGHYWNVDRREAIYQALKQAEPGDVVLVAGKGHEDYQIIGQEKIDFCDRQVIENYQAEAKG